jgi:hypothetical protein
MKTSKQDKQDKARTKKLLSYFRDSADDLIFWTFRYFLGRMTIHTSCFADDLAEAWPYLDKRVADLIKKELEKAFQQDDEMRLKKSSYNIYPLGSNTSRSAWENVRCAYSNTTSCTI